jgi:ribulose 1,5-bisphosphate carboxylase large subunit-like protein
MSKIFRYFEYYHTKTYTSVLDDIVTAYNNTIHSSLGQSNSSVTKENEMDTWLRVYRKLYETKWNMIPKYQEGNFVRIKTKKDYIF